MKTYIFLPLVLISLFVKAQESKINTKTDSLIKINVVHNGRFSSIFYTFNNERLSKPKLISILKTNPKSAEQLNKYYKQRKKNFILLPITITSFVVGCVQADNKKNIAGSVFSKAPIPFSFFFALAINSSIITFKNNNHVQKAIEIYNNTF